MIKGQFKKLALWPLPKSLEARIAVAAGSQKARAYCPEFRIQNAEFDHKARLENELDDRSRLCRYSMPGAEEEGLPWHDAE